MRKKMALLLVIFVIVGVSLFSVQTGLMNQVFAGGDDSGKSVQTESVNVGNFSLQLTGSKLTYRSQSKSGECDFADFADFAFSSKYRFSRNSDDKIRIVKTGKTQTLLVESSIKEANGDCLTKLREIVISANDIRLSRNIQTVSQCLPAVWDEKMYHILAANTVPIPVKK